MKKKGVNEISKRNSDSSRTEGLVKVQPASIDYLRTSFYAESRNTSPEEKAKSLRHLLAQRVKSKAAVLQLLLCVL